MRLVEVLIPEGEREPVLAALDDEGVDYAVFDETGRGDFEAMVSFPIPSSGVEPVLDRLYAAGIREEAYTIVSTPDTVVSERIAELEGRYTGLRIARDELRARAIDLAPATSTYFAFLVLSTVIATTGLLLDSAATIIGAMVVAPLMGPAITASVGTVIDDRDLASRGVALQVGGLLLAIAVGAVIGLIVKESVLIPPGTDIRQIPQVAERTSPNFLSLFLAIGSGLAGAISVMRQGGSALVGVAIAVALIPPAATSGLGIAWGLPGVAIAGAVLVLVNLLSINVSALALFWLSGYRPEAAEAVGRARAAVITRAAVLLVAIAVLSIVLGLVTFASFQAASFQQQTTAEVATMFDEEPAFAEMRFENAEVVYKPSDILLGNPAQVTVITGIPSGYEPPPDVAQRIDDRLTETSGVETHVRVGFVEAQETGDVRGAATQATRSRLPHP